MRARPIALLGALVAISSVLVFHPSPVGAAAGDTVPALIPLTNTAGLINAGGEWDTNNQHRSWWNEAAPDGGRWDAVLPVAATTDFPAGPAAGTSDWWIASGAVTATPTYGPVVDTGSSSRPDIFWNGSMGDGRLYVLVSGSTTRFYSFDYTAGDPGAYTLVTGPVDIVSMNSGASRATIYQSPNGYLWASVMTAGGLLVSRSIDQGTTWAPPANLAIPLAAGQTHLAHFDNGGTNYVAVAAAEDGGGNDMAGRQSKFHFYSVDEGEATWDAVAMAQGTITMDTAMPTEGETVTIDAKTYTFTASLVNDGDVAIGGTLAQAQLNLVAAISRGGTPGVDYASSTTTHPTVSMSAFIADAAVITALESGTAGNAIPTTETMTNGSLDAATLGTTTAGASPWTAEVIPLASPDDLAHSDDEISLVRDGSDNLYVVAETQIPGSVPDVTIQPQVVLFKRTPAGTWTQHVVEYGHVDNSNDRKRPVVSIIDNGIYVIAVNKPRTESSYKTVDLGSLASITAAPWTELINVSSKNLRNNIVPRFATTSVRGLPVMIDNLTDSTIWQAGLTANQPPAVSAGLDAVASLHWPNNLNGTVVDDGKGGVLTNAWTQVSGPGTATFGDASLPATTAEFDALGTYVLRLTSTETGPDALSNFDDVEITVNDTFIDDDDSIFEPDIEWLVAEDITSGCNAVGPLYCPAGSLSRAQMATFLAKALKLTPIPGPGFLDVSGTHEANINAIADRGITVGCDPDGLYFCPDQIVNRAQMATFLAKAMELTPIPGPGFLDVSGVHEANINAIAAISITLGCDANGDYYCPANDVTRQQMAAFLRRAFG